MRSVFLFLFMFIAIQVHAKEVKMAVIMSEFDKNVTTYFLEVDDENTLHSLRYKTVAPNGSIIQDQTVTPEQIMDNGVVVFEHRGYNAVILQVENFNVKTGGIIKINYLYSGVTGERHVRKFNLKLVGGDFLLFDKDTRVNKMFFEVNRNRVLGIIGVKSIHTSFEPSFAQLD